MEQRERNSRKEREGVVVSNKMQKTVTVRVEKTERHPEFKKVIRRAKKYYAHVDEELAGKVPGGVLQVGQKVRIVETRPLSKLKCWRVAEVVA